MTDKVTSAIAKKRILKKQDKNKNDNVTIDISFIINAHREKLILVPALKSAFLASEDCISNGISIEIIVIGDKIDPITQNIVNKYLEKIDCYESVKYGNLGEARMHALSLCRGDFVCFLDGDDIWQKSWPRSAFFFAKNYDYRNTVFHTEIFAAFGGVHFFRHQISTNSSLFHPLNLISTWHFCNNLFAHRSIFKRHPITPYDHKQGYGSEDWHWSCETVAAGINRTYVPRTVYFYRLNSNKPSLGSIKNLTLRPTQLFSNQKCLQTYASYSGLNNDSLITNVSLVEKIFHTKTAERWLYDEIRDTTNIDSDIFSLINNFHQIKVSTPKLYVGVSFAFSKVGIFVQNKPYILLGIDCETISEDLLALIMLGLRLSSDNEKKVVIFCGDKLTGGKLIQINQNILMLNILLLMRAQNYDSYSTNNLFSNIISNFKPESIVNINLEYIDYLTGDYSLLLNSLGIRTSKIFLNNPNDIACRQDRQFLAELNSGKFHYNELWVRSTLAQEYLFDIYKYRNISIEVYDSTIINESIKKIIFDRKESTEEHKLNKTTFTLCFIRQNRVDVSCVLNLHQEKELVIPTLHSVNRMLSFTNKRALAVELIIILDSGDEKTKEILYGAKNVGLLNNNTRLIEVDHKNLGASRRVGVNQALGEYIAFLDGDDLYSENWITQALSTCRASVGKEIICHPEINVYFGAEQRLFWHPDGSRVEIPEEGLLLDNYWTSLSFAKRQIYLDIPILDIDHESGFGFEDWHWNLETSALGIEHKIAPRTLHFIRLKPSGSLNKISAAHNVMTRPSAYARKILFN